MNNKSNNIRISRLKNGKSFKQWCIENNKQNYLDLWDFDLNILNPNEINYSSHKKYYFKCPKGLHKSELKEIARITNNNASIVCNQCNSFEQWCLDKNRQDLSDRWDYVLNDCNPCDISFGTARKYYLKCPNDLHTSELHNIGSITSGQNGSSYCKACNSFAQWGINNICKDFLEKYWDYENNLNINPWEISYGSNQKVWIRCQEKDYHGSYFMPCISFSIQKSRCPFCTNKNGKVHTLDSLGTLHPKVLDIWSDKNKKSPFAYAPKSHQEIYWKCSEGKHEDYKRIILNSNNYDFRCPECQYSQGEFKIQNIFDTNNISYIPQKEFDGLIGLGERNLSYDFYIPSYNLLIEYQGEYHDGTVPYQTKKQFEKQQEHDRRKRVYAKNNNINLLEIWYWDFDRIEEILNNELKKYNLLD